MTWRITTPLLGAQPITEISTTAKHPLGTIVRAKDATYGEGEFIYLLGVGNTVVGLSVTWNATTHQTTLSPDTASTGNPLAVAMAANVASSYGWYQIEGLTVWKKTAVAIPPGAVIHHSATTGRVMNTVASGKQVLGARSANLTSVTTTTSTVVVSINRPHVQGARGAA